MRMSERFHIEIRENLYLFLFIFYLFIFAYFTSFKCLFHLFLFIY